MANANELLKARRKTEQRTLENEARRVYCEHFGREAMLARFSSTVDEFREGGSGTSIVVRQWDSLDEDLRKEILEGHGPEACAAERLAAFVDMLEALRRKFIYKPDVGNFCNAMRCGDVESAMALAGEEFSCSWLAFEWFDELERQLDEALGKRRDGRD